MSRRNLQFGALRTFEAAADGVGVAVGYLQPVDRDLQAGRLVTASAATVRHPFSYCPVYPEAKHKSGKSRAFRDWNGARAG